MDVETQTEVERERKRNREFGGLLHREERREKDARNAMVVTMD